MNVLKRLLLFLVCFIVIAMTAFFIAGAIVGAIAIRDAGDVSKAREIGRSAGLAFGVHYNLHILISSLLISAGIAFRWRGALVVVFLVLLMYLLYGANTPLLKPSAQNTPALAATVQATSPIILAGRRMSLVSPITIDLPYGKVQMPAGTVVQVLSETRGTVNISVAGCQTSVPRTNLR